MSLGARLKKEREKRKWSQILVAHKIGITNAVLSNYERDYRDPDTETLKKLAELYDVSIDYLLGKSSHPNLTVEEEKEVDKEVEEYLEILESVPEDKRELLRERILAYARGLADASQDN